MGDAELGERPADLGQLRLIDFPAVLGGDEVMPAPIGIKRAEQAVFGDRLGQSQETRDRAFLVHQDRRIDLPVAPSASRRGRDRAPAPQSNHASSRPGTAACPAAADAPASCDGRRAAWLSSPVRRLQRQPRHRIAEPVVMPTHKLLVECFTVKSLYCSRKRACIRLSSRAGARRGDSLSIRRSRRPSLPSSS